MAELLLPCPNSDLLQPTSNPAQVELENEVSFNLPTLVSTAAEASLDEAKAIEQEESTSTGEQDLLELSITAIDQLDDFLANSTFR